MSFTKYLPILPLLATATLALAAGPVLPRVDSIPESKMVRKIQPLYPLEAADLGVNGVVLIDAVISKDGHVENMRLRSGHPLLAPAAMQAVRKWVFQPVMVDGKPARVVTEVSVPFTAAARRQPAQRKPGNGQPGATF